MILVAAVSVLLWSRARRQREDYAAAYVSDPSAIVWNANAQVRQQIGTLHYGERVVLLRRAGERAQIRSAAGVQGWVDAAALMDADLWRQGAELLERAKKMPPQAFGHTRTISNVRLAPGRDGPRIYQFGRNEPVAVLERAASPVPQEEGEEAGAGAASGKREDWLLVMRNESAEGGRQTAPGTASISAQASPSAPAKTPIAGWVLARFIELDPPAPIPDYFSASHLRVVAWRVLNTVPGENGPVAQYLVAGSRGGEGQPCDFSLLRVYTWHAARQRYETAFIENDICGRLPIIVTPAPMGADFHFEDPSRAGGERAYIFRQTVVRRVTKIAAAPRPASRRPARAAARRRKTAGR